MGIFKDKPVDDGEGWMRMPRKIKKTKPGSVGDDAKKRIKKRREALRRAGGMKKKK